MDRMLRLVQRIADELPVGVWVGAVPDGNLVYSNAAFAEIMGQPGRDHVLARDLASRYGLHSVGGVPYPEAELPFSRVVATGAPAEVDDVVVHRADGRRVPLHAWARPIRGEEGRVTHVTVAFVDITDQRQAEARLLAVDLASPNAVGITRQSDSRVIYVNAAMCGLLDCEPEQALGLPAPDFYEDLAERESVLAELRANGSVEGRRVWLKTRAGSRFLGAVHLRPVEVGGEPCVLGSILDVTAVYETERMLRHSIAEKDVLLREIHHRVKNNLQVVSSMLSLQISVTRDSHARSVLEDSRSRIATMAAVHETLYGAESLSEFRLDTFIEQLASQILVLAGDGAPDVRLDLEPMKTDMDTALPCGLILNELLTNALKHAFVGDTGTVHIGLGRVGEGYELVVQDDGKGMDPEVVRDPSTLGMRLISALASQIDGQLEVVSAPGAGTTFRFHF